jgi:hypothetical protein
VGDANGVCSIYGGGRGSFSLDGHSAILGDRSHPAIAALFIPIENVTNELRH